MEHIQKGIAGEEKASLFLKDLGYEILVRNFRYGRGEIDIIAKIETCICFVEVKYRKNNRFGYPEVFVTDKKLKKIMQTAEAYILQTNWHGRIRYDVISITGNEHPVHLVDVT